MASTPTSKDPAEVTHAYFQSWQAGDFEGLRPVLADSLAPAAPTANWSHVENGKITAIRVTFDARPPGAGLHQEAP